MNQFVNYTLAKSMKRIGFKIDCLAVIDQTEFLQIKGSRKVPRAAMCYDEIPCPTWQQCFDYFRDIHKRTSHIDIHKVDEFGHITYYYKIHNFENGFEENGYIKVAGYHSLYETATKCLEELLNYVK